MKHNKCWSDYWNDHLVIIVTLNAVDDHHFLLTSASCTRSFTSLSLVITKKTHSCFWKASNDNSSDLRISLTLETPSLKISVKYSDLGFFQRSESFYSFSPSTLILLHGKQFEICNIYKLVYVQVWLFVLSAERHWGRAAFTVNHKLNLIYYPESNEGSAGFLHASKNSIVFVQ